MSNLPAGFDSWLTRTPEYIEEPCEVTIEQDYDCSACGCSFKGDVVTGNYQCEYDDEDHKWSVKHIECPPDEEVA